MSNTYTENIPSNSVLLYIYDHIESLFYKA